MIYSPSRTEDWLHCPMFSHYRRMGLEPRVAGPAEWEIALPLGRSIHKGLEAYYAGARSPEAALAAGFGEAERQYVDQETYTREGFHKLVARGIGFALDPPVLDSDEVVVAVEDEVGECRADLVTRKPGVGLRIVDFKTKQSLKSEWRRKELDRYATSWQMRHTAWAIGEKYGEPVVDYRIQLIVLSPKGEALTETYPLGAERLAAWLASAERVWAAMDGAPWMNTKSCFNFGSCRYFRLCHDLAGDVSAAGAFYEGGE